MTCIGAPPIAAPKSPPCPRPDLPPFAMSDAPRSVVLHGHFYQPPRENPWTGQVPVEPNAAPAHDWNQRVHDECYRAVTAARVLDGEGRIARVVNTLELMSWDAGATLLSWMEREAPETYQAFLDADARSVERLGHGNAIAAPYHHVILPLAPRRDKITEVRWGMADFRRRFGRDPEGMWLPETAVDTETLEVLAAEGILFTVLGPGQVKQAPPDGLPGRVHLPSGAEIAVFVYDGGLSHDVAFGGLLRDGHAWARRMAEPPDGRRLVSLATDGETFGHHHKWADMALAAALLDLEARPGVRLENYASFLAANPPETDVVLVEPSSWSCAHGVERWRSECGCKMDPSRPTQQKWRPVLRDALSDLAVDLHGAFEDEGAELLAEPWAARDAYGAAFHRDDDARRRFVVKRAGRLLSDIEVARALALLEMERDSLRMFTSCGWFFDDLAGLEPLQVLRYAAHALDLLGEDGEPLERRLLERLATAESNDPDKGTGADLWRDDVRASASTPAELPAPSGAAPLVVGLEEAVARFLGAPGTDTAAEAVIRANALAESGVPVPFDVQTRVGRVLPALSREAPEATAEVALALGFGEEAVAADQPLVMMKSGMEPKPS